MKNSLSNYPCQYMHVQNSIHSNTRNPKEHKIHHNHVPNLYGVVRKVEGKKKPRECKNRQGTLNAPMPKICAQHKYDY